MLRVVIGKAEVSQENKYRWGKKAYQRWNPAWGTRTFKR